METRMSLYHHSSNSHSYKKSPTFFAKHKWLILILLVILGAISAFIGYQKYQNYLINRYEVKGILVNQNNGYIDFVTLANSNQQFVYIRATQGATYTDDDFSDNFQRSQGSGLQVGAYHVFSTQSDIRAQLKNFTREVGSDYGTLPPMIDVPDELTAGQIRQLTQFIFDVHRYYDTNIVVRSNYDVFTKLGKKLNHDVQYFSPDIKNHRANFIELKNNRNLNIDGIDVTVNQVAFNGNRFGWQRYLLRNRNH